MSSAREFAAAVWRTPEVERLCLEMQDRHGQCPALLLWRAWTLRIGAPVDRGVVDQAVALTRAWDAAILKPLRSVRRSPVLGGEPFVSVGAAAIRARLLPVEIAAEGVLLDGLQGLTPETTGQSAPWLPGLADIARVWGEAPPPDLIEALASALDRAGP